MLLVHDSSWPDGQERPRVNNMKWILILTMIAFSGCASAKKQSPAQTPSTEAVSATASAHKVNTSISPVSPTDEEKISCTRAAENRTLEVTKKGAGCELNYSKAGKSSAVASSSHGVGHCMESAKKISAKLGKAGFKCT